MARPPGLVMRAAGDGPSLRQHALHRMPATRTPPVGHHATPCLGGHVRLEREGVDGGAERQEPWACTAEHPMHLARGSSFRVETCARGNQGARRQVARRKLVERAVASAVVAERGEGVWKQGRAVRTAPAHRGHAPNAARRRPRRGTMPSRLRQICHIFERYAISSADRDLDMPYLPTTQSARNPDFSCRNHGSPHPLLTYP